MMTKEEVFRKVRDHLLKQGARSEHGRVCRYRDNSGRACAVGCLIPDERYDPRIEGDPASVLTMDSLPDVPRTCMPMLSSLQRIHDHHEPKEWEALLRKEARDQGIPWERSP